MPPSNKARIDQLSHLTEHAHAVAEVSRDHTDHRSASELAEQEKEQISDMHRQAEAEAHSKHQK